MALTRGAKGLCSCPCCLVPSKSTSDLSKTYALRNQKSSMELVDPEKYTTAAAREEKMKEHGLRPVEVSNTYCRVHIVIFFHRMYSGGSIIQIHTRQFHGIVFMPSTVGFLDITYGLK